MENRQILRRFEVNLQDKLIQDVISPGTTVRSGIWPPVSPEGEDKHDEKQNKDNCMIVLEKTSDSVIRLFVTGTGQLITCC